MHGPTGRCGTVSFRRGRRLLCACCWPRLTAWVRPRREFRRGVIEALTFIPCAFPGTALAIGCSALTLCSHHCRLRHAVDLLIGYTRGFFATDCDDTIDRAMHDEVPQASVAAARVPDDFLANPATVVTARLSSPAGSFLATIFFGEGKNADFLYHRVLTLVALLYHF